MYVYPQDYIGHSLIAWSLFIKLKTRQSFTQLSYHCLLLLLLFYCYPVTKFLDCSKPHRGQRRYSMLGISTFALLGRIYIRVTRAVFHSSSCALIMASKDLLQDTVEYNRKINLARKMLKSKKYPLPTLPLMS